MSNFIELTEDISINVEEIAYTELSTLCEDDFAITMKNGKVFIFPYDEDKLDEIKRAIFH